MGRFKGFTLTELMIALGVIGIILAVVTPAIMKTSPNKNKMMIKKTFYTVEQIVSSLINDEKLYPDKTDKCEDTTDYSDCRWGFDDTDKVQYDGNDYGSDTSTSDDAKNKFAELFKAKLNISSVDASNSSLFYTTDGVQWNVGGVVDAWTAGKKKVGTFEDQDSDTPGIGRIRIDVNGDDGPNCRQSEDGCDADDFDQYVIQILANGKLRISPGDDKAVEYATINTSIRN